MVFDGFKAFFADVMFHAARVFGGRLFVNAKADQPRFQKLVPFINHLSDLFSLVGQIDEAGFRHSNITVFAELLHCDAHTGFFESHAFSDIDGAHDGEFIAQHQNSFQVIF